MTSRIARLFSRAKAREKRAGDLEVGEQSSSSTLSRTEYFDILAKRVLHSRTYAGFYLSLVGAGLVEVAWILLPQGGVGQLPRHFVFTIVESYVTVGLVLELALRAALQRRGFWHRLSNTFDMVVAAVSILSTLLFVAGVETRSEALFADLLVTGRVFFRLLRLVAITKSFRRQHASVARAPLPSQKKPTHTAQHRHRAQHRHPR